MNTLLFLFSFFVSFLVLEIVVRYLYSPSPVPAHTSLFRNFSNCYTYPEKWTHPALGWVSPGNVDGYGPFDNYTSYNAMGLRNNDNSVTVPEKPAVLAMGDSFTFGVEVDNADAWPAQLEGQSRVRVFNGGVNGYGLGQMLTRTRILLDRLNNVDMVIVAFIGEDIKRVKEKKHYSAPKPYYTAKNGKLVLQELQPEDFSRRDYFKAISGYSYAIHLFMSKAFTDYWNGVKYADTDEVEVSCRIVDAFAELAGAHNLQSVVFALLPTHSYDVSLVKHPVTQYIRDVSQKNARVFVVDLQKALRSLIPLRKIILPRKETAPKAEDTDAAEPFSFFNDSSKGYHGHYSRKGNEFVAREIASFLRTVAPDIFSLPQREIVPEQSDCEPIGPASQT